MFSLPSSHVTLSAIAATGLLALLSACGGPSEQEWKAMQQAASQVGEMQQEIKSVRGRLIELETDVNLLSDDMTSLKGAKAQAAQLSPEDRKLIDEMKKKIETLQADLDKARKEAAAAPREAAAPRPAESGAAAAGATARASRAPGNLPEPVADPAAANPKDKGSYYDVQKGDTIESIAAAKGVSASKIRAANKIPSGRNPTAGARIFVPAP